MRLHFQHPAGILAACLLLACSQGYCGQDLTLTDGRILRDAEIIKVEGTAVLIRSAEGTNRIAIADLPADTRRTVQEAEIQRKAGEIERMRRELEQQEKELQTLEKAAGATNSVLPSSPAKPAPAVPPAQVQLPVNVQPDDHISARDLHAFFKADPKAAAAVFKDKPFVLDGRIIGFSPALFVRRYEVLVDSGDSGDPVEIRFGFASEWQSVYPIQGGRELIARQHGLLITLAEKNQNISLRVRFREFSDERVYTTALEPIR